MTKKLSLPIWAVHLLMLLTSLMIAATFVVGEAITAGLAPQVLTLIRFIIAVLLFAPWIGLRFGWRTVWCCSFSLLVRCGIISLCLTGFFIGMFYALRYTSALNTSVIYTLVPALSALFSFFLVKERCPLRRTLALLCGIIGAVWVIFRGRLDLLLAMQWGYGDVVFAAACLAMSLYTPLLKLFHRGEEMEVFTYWILVTGAGWLALYAGRDMFAADFASVSEKVWLGILYLAVFPTILSFYLTQAAIAYIGPTRVIAWSYIYPALVVLLEFAAGKGIPQGGVLPGIVVIAFAMVLLMGERENGEVG